jgi:hypothetical protein
MENTKEVEKIEVDVSGYGDYSSDNYGVNCLRLQIGGLTLYLSYKTVIAFHTIETGKVIRKNDWSTTTGKHLNWINADKKRRISGDVFENQLNEVLNKYNYNV